MSTRPRQPFGDSVSYSLASLEFAKAVMESAQSSGDLVSSDPLQGLAEIVQNADDVEATEIRLLLEPTELLVSHNGSQVRLPHVLALATPWLTTKGSQAALMGRFGIGLTTLRSLSETLEVHCEPYHVRFGGSFRFANPSAAANSRIGRSRMDHLSGSAGGRARSVRAELSAWLGSVG